MGDAGIEIPSTVVEQVENVKTKQKKDFAFFKVVDKKVVGFVSDYPTSDEDVAEFEKDSKTREENWKTRVYPKFFDALKEIKEPIWCVLDFRCIDESSGRKITKVLLINWSPDKSSVSAKMIFASTSKKLREKLNIPKWIEAHVAADIGYAELLEKATST
eukprot:TRINITY_DN48047_c0_g1_i3.p1 TRINITY_DN48047_c0_g1~~TRINITY_DN48047_c0_g1_i3.p1  ORF type:complete len:160 (+),score=27.08 TRINITY_DN48047_c0_g1_i3:96-575(+)